MLWSNSIGFDSWAFDVSALMILISENDEQQYRLAGRSLIEALTAAPVSGLQNYIRSYDLLLYHSQLSYFSPYGCKSAPLRNMKLDNVIVQRNLLKDNKFTKIKIKSPPRTTFLSTQLRPLLWAAFTWLVVGASLAAAVLSRKTTWIGILNAVGLIFWSIILRIIEHFKLRLDHVPTRLISSPDSLDTAFILGRNASGVLIEGRREDLKRWTSSGLVYRHGISLPNAVWQCFTRVGTFLVLIVIFATIPNGSTMDQLLFIVINILAQANTLVGRWLNSTSASQQLDSSSGTKYMPSRTHLYAEILRQCNDVEDRSWIDKMAFLPQTDVWSKWKDCILDGSQEDPKQLYNRLSNEKE